MAQIYVVMMSSVDDSTRAGTAFMVRKEADALVEEYYKEDYRLYYKQEDEDFVKPFDEWIEDYGNTRTADYWVDTVELK